MSETNDCHDLIDTLLDRLDKAGPDELAEMRRRAAVVDAQFDPNKPVDKEELARKVAAWRQREADRLFHG